MRLRTALGLAIVLMAIAFVPPAWARSTAVEQDRSDNRFGFTYDSETGEMPTQTSSRRHSRDDEVDFEVRLKESNGDGSGLIGSLTLKLIVDHEVDYDGWFTLQVTNDGGGVAYRRSRPEVVVLRPSPGQREAKLNFRFDLPSGTYSALGLFEKK